MVSNNSAEDPQNQNATQITFEISVPDYVSDSLGIQLLWGSKEFDADWMGDVYWSATETFPTNAELPLEVTFPDRKGEIILGRFNTDFKTGTNAAETYQIAAAQFETQSWDEDSDGKSNIEELSVGSNPFVDESLPIEVRESIHVVNVDVVSRFYEKSTPSDRPFFKPTEENTPLTTDPVVSYGVTHIVTIDLDDNGTGTFSDKYVRTEPSNRHTINQVATRTHTDNTVQWAGEFYQYAYSAHVGTDLKFYISTKALDEWTRQQEGWIDDDDIGYRRPSTEVSYSLIGKVVEDSSNCQPVAGSITGTGNPRLPQVL